MLKKYGRYFAGVITLLFLTSFSASADVSVYAEGAYTDDDLMVYIYADVVDDPIVSYGVKLTYNTEALELNLGIPDDDDPIDGVIKNNEDWYFGASPPGFATPNADPDTLSVAGEIVIVGGKIDSDIPTEGVLDTRVLLAKVFFTRITGDTFDIALLLGKDGDYANFVQVDSTVLDTESAPVFDIGAVEIHQRGDVNGDNIVNILDMGAVKNYMVNGGVVYPWMDCNSDGNINILDMGCVKGIMTQ